METRTLGHAGARGLGAGPRLHGHVRVLRRSATRPRRSRRSTGRSSSASRSSTPPTCTGRSRTRSSSGGRSPAAATGSCWRRSSATSAATNGEFLGIDGEARVRARGLRRVAAAARRRPHRPLLPAPGRPETCRSRRRSARWPSSCRRARCATSASPRRRRRRSAARTPCIRSRRCRPSTRSGRATPRTEILPTVRELGIGFVAYSPLGRGFLTGRIRSLDDLAEDDFRRRPPALPGRELRAEPRRSSSAVEELAAEKGVDAGAARARVGARAGRRRRPDPRHEAARVPRGERGRGRRRADRGRPRAARRALPGRSARRATAIRTCRPSTAERRRLARRRSDEIGEREAFAKHLLADLTRDGRAKHGPA